MSDTAAGRYTQLVSNRTTYLNRARDCAKLTIPTLMPPEGHGAQTVYSTPYQGMGARGVNNLAAKLLLALFPPNTPFFRLVIDDYMIDKMTGQEGMRGEVDKALNKMERAVQSEVEAFAFRVTAFETIKHLINDGNGLAYLPPEGGMRFFRLDRYVVLRDPMGNPLEILVEEEVSPMMLPDVIQQHIKNTEGDKSIEKTIKLYTWVKRTPKEWKVFQEACGIIIPKTRGTYPLDKSPWLPLRWTKIDGEDYGRSHVEEYLGDLRSLEALSQAIVEGSAAAAKVLFLVKPNGSTKVETLTNSPNGAVRAGNAEDVTCLQVEKAADFRVASETAQNIEQRLSQAFLLASSVQRQAERVTAEEIRVMASELEDSLGGVYSVLSQEFQLPLVNRLMFQMEKQGRLPSLPKGMIKPAITTGMEALGRGNDVTKLQTLLQDIAPLGPEVISKYLNVTEYIKRCAVGRGIEAAGLINGDEEIAQADQQAQLMALVQKLGPNAINLLGPAMDPSKNGQNPQDIQAAAAEAGAQGVPPG